MTIKVKLPNTNKYHNTKINGYDSIKEYSRGLELRQWQKKRENIKTGKAENFCFARKF